MVQSDQYNTDDEVSRVSEFPGADKDDELIIVRVAEGELDIEDREGRQLGVVEVGSPIGLVDTEGNGVDPSSEDTLSEISSKVATESSLSDIVDALGSNGNDYVVIGQDGPLDVSGAVVSIQEDSPLDVSGSVVSVQEDSALDVSGAVVSIQEDSPLDVSGSTVNVQEDSPLDVSGSVVTITEESAIDVSVTSLPDVLKTENYGVDIETDYQAVLNVGSYSLVDITATTAVNTSITVEKSWDQDNWFEVESASDVSKLDQNMNNAGGEYYRVTVTGTGTAGDTGNVVIAAKSG